MNKIKEILYNKSLENYHNIVFYLRDIIKGTEFEGKLYTVGGCVRDILMHNHIKDIDMVVNMPNGGIKFANWLYKNNYVKGSVVVYETYGTAMLKLSKFPFMELEFVQTRKEQYRDKNSRNPETCYGTIEEDCYRRDLTINSLYYNVSEGKIIDITGLGISDINNHIIRTPCDPDITYNDDPLRILRCIRFATRYGWTNNISEATLNGMLKNVDRLSIITQERITDEFNKIICNENAVLGLELMKKVGAMKYVIPELEKTYDLKQSKHHFGTVWEHTLSVVDKVVGTTELRLAALLHDIGKINTMKVTEDGMIHFYKHDMESSKMCYEILKRMKYSNEIINFVTKVVNLHMRTKPWGDDCKMMSDRKLRKLQYNFNNLEEFQLYLEIVDADNKSHAKEYCLNNQVDRIFKRTMEMVEDGSTVFKNFKLPINGNDIMKLKNIKPSNEVKLYIDYLLKLSYINPKMTKEECLTKIKNIKLC